MYFCGEMARVRASIQLILISILIMSTKSTVLVISLLCLLITSCKKDEETPSITPELKKSVAENYASIVYASYSDSKAQLLVLKQKAQALVTTPSATALTEARTAYIAARAPYEQTEAYRFYGGPIDNDTDGPEGLMNGWPLDESFIDYTVDDANSGIINDLTTYPTINKTLIANLNEEGGETNISSGYHAVEFLLWGQDLSASGPGNRPFTDYLSTPNGTAQNQARRGQYLLAAIDLLLENMDQLIAAWAPSQTNNYRATFTTTANLDTSLVHIITGLGKFGKGELSGERMAVALNNQDQEDEHSCFSDQTHNDIIGGQKSIYNVYIGKYTRTDGTVVDGPGIDDLVKVTHATLNTELKGLLDAATTKASEIPAPFDQAIINSRTKVQDAINAIRAESDKLVQAADAIGYKVAL
jgi:putative iron-regulated protein